MTELTYEYAILPLDETPEESDWMGPRTLHGDWMSEIDSLLHESCWYYPENSLPWQVCVRTDNKLLSYVVASRMTRVFDIRPQWAIKTNKGRNDE